MHCARLSTHSLHAESTTVTLFCTALQTTSTDDCSPSCTVPLITAIRQSDHITPILADHGDLVVPRALTTRFSSRSFRIAGPSTWNGLPSNIRSASTREQFKRSLKSWLFECACGRRRVWDTFVWRRALQIFLLLLLLLPKMRCKQTKLVWTGRLFMCFQWKFWHHRSIFRFIWHTLRDLCDLDPWPFDLGHRSRYDSPLLRHGAYSIFKIAAIRHLGLLKIRNFNGRLVAAGQIVSSTHHHAKFRGDQSNRLQSHHTRLTWSTVSEWVVS